MWFRASVLFKYHEGTWEECKRAIEEMHQKECPDKWLRLYSEEEVYNDYLHSENMLTKLLEAASLVCILISIFGIYSLITLTCEQRRKEIAIRKVNGAKISNILQMFFKEYMLLLTIASLVAFPASYAVMKQWLETYNRQTEIGAWVFITIFIGFAVVIIGSIGYRVWKAANENPADVVKSE
jgi:ABC-type antimicrobial peptide transport system permease subunit